MRVLWDFPGGIELEEHKSCSTARPVGEVPLPKRLVIPLQQHTGEAPEPRVRVGDHVLGGDVLAHATGYVSAAVHAGSSGTVVAIEPHPVPHPSGLTTPCVILETDGHDRWAPPLPTLERRALDPVRLRQRARECGLVGLGGAAFPSSVKLNAAPGAVEQLILNGAECEPWITCDEMLMRTRPRDVVEGVALLALALRAGETLIAVEDNKHDAIAALNGARESLGADAVEIVPVPARYPAGGEKQLIQMLTGREVPSGGLPLDIGVLCHNVATAAALRCAVVDGRPLTSRYVTVTGDGVAEPRVVDARIGTPFRHLIDRCGGYTDGVERLLMGGPMMGFTVENDSVPVIKATNCILAASTGLFPRPAPALPCIRCGACADACPASLMPQQLYWHARAGDVERAREHDLFDCIECGVCAYVCPSHIPLIEYFRFAKTDLATRERERLKADVARDRYLARQQRLEHEESERRTRRQRKKAALQTGRNDSAPDAGERSDRANRKAAVQAALERARRKKAGDAHAPDTGSGKATGTDHENDDSETR